MVLVASAGSFAATESAAQTRSLKIHFTHTRERAEVVFKRNGRFDQNGLRQLNHLLRDWRRNEPTQMDPRLFDLLWELYQASGSRDYIHVVSAYRSPATNNMLRSRSSGVAQKSQHTLGKAIDFFIPDVPVRRLRELGMKFQVGGVGYYPNSGSPFVHLDVGSVRAWPRMSRQQLVALFPDGKTLHVPPDGRRLAGYDAALADYKRRVGSSQIAVAGGGAGGGDAGSGNRRNLLAMLFGNNGDEDEDATAITSGRAVSPRQPEQGAPRVPARPAATAVAQAPAPQAAPPAQPQAVAAAGLPASARAPIPVERPVIGQVPPPQVAGLAPVGPSAPPPGVTLAEATLPANAPALPARDEPETEVAAVEDVPAPRRYADLSGYSVPVPSFLGDRSGVSVYAADDAPAFDGRDVTDVLLAEAEEETPVYEQALQTALVPRPASRPEFAAIEAATSGNREAGEAARLAAVSERNTAITQPSGGVNAPAVAERPVPTERPVETAALTPVGGDGHASGDPDAASNVAARMAGAFHATPLKGARPSEADAARSGSRTTLRAEPKLTERMISNWAIGTERLAMVTKPVKSPRFVDRQLRASPAMVYTAGFSADDVAADRFTGTAVNFLSVARFAERD